MTSAPRPLQKLYNQVKNMRQYIKPEIEFIEIDGFHLLFGSKTETEDPTGGDGGGGVPTDKPDKPFGSKDGFPWSDDFDMD